MSHFIKGGSLAGVYSRNIGKIYCAVKVKFKSNKLYVEDGGISVVKPDTKIAELPTKFKVYNSENEEVQPSGKFYISVETINPFHLLMDLPSDF